MMEMCQILPSPFYTYLQLENVIEIAMQLLCFQWSVYCEAQARIGKGWPLRRKASKLKALPRAYIKVGCHPPTHHQKLIVKLRQGSGKDRQEMALKAEGLKASTLALSLH